MSKEDEKNKIVVEKFSVAADESWSGVHRLGEEYKTAVLDTLEKIMVDKVPRLPCILHNPMHIRVEVGEDKICINCLRELQLAEKTIKTEEK